MKRSKIYRSDGSALIEVALIIALVAMIALPAVRTAGRNATKPMCAYILGLETGSVDISARWYLSGGTPRCTYDGMVSAW